MARLEAAGRAVLVTAALLIERRVHGPENEAAADARALELCLAAGYNGSHCIQLFDILESDALDRGDLDGVFGLEDSLDPAVREGHVPCAHIISLGTLRVLAG